MNAIESQGYTENQNSRIIFNCALSVHRTLGPGLLINFNITLIKNGLRRVVNNL
jgi:hypothetical protein